MTVITIQESHWRLTEATELINRHQNVMKYETIAAGIMSILLRILVFTNQLLRIANAALPEA